MPKISNTAKAKKKTSKTMKKKKTKKKEDSTKPKGKCSAYMFFSKEVRKVVKNEHPDFDFGEVAKEVARRWKLVKDTPSAATYRKKAKADAERHMREMASWTPPPESETSESETSESESEDDDEDEEMSDAECSEDDSVSKKKKKKKKKKKTKKTKKKKKKTKKKTKKKNGIVKETKQTRGVRFFLPSFRTVQEPPTRPSF
jgi:hypothetical protein